MEFIRRQLRNDAISVNVLKEERPSVQWLFNQSEQGIMGVEALKITNRNITMEVINHYRKLQGKQ